MAVLQKYGRKWPNFTALDIELRCFIAGLSPQQGGLGRAGHFKEAVKLIWPGERNGKNFVWHPWADEMLERACQHRYLSISGCASSGKSEFFGIWAIVNWLAAPMATMCLVTSTSLKESRKRIWGVIEDWWRAAIPGLPGTLVSSIGTIRLEDPVTGYVASERAGITLIAGEKRREKESIGKLIGLKNERVILIADELPELSMALLEAAMSNLESNPFFQLVGIGNPASIYDPHGVLSRPTNGWKSVSPALDGWETDKGYAIRFDAEMSPNVVAGKTIYPWMVTREKLAAAKKDLGEDSLGFWRMYRGFWCPSGSMEGVFSEADIIKFDCEDKKVFWRNPPQAIACLDPGYTNGGDRSVLYFGLFGEDVTGKQTLLFTDYELLFENAMRANQPRDFQIAEQFRDKCIARNVRPDNAGYDATGAGGPFGSIVESVWSELVNRIYFGGGASMVPVSATDRTPAKEKYANRVSEIWYSGKEFMRAGQLKGICPDLAIELTARRGDTRKEGKNVLLKVEPKDTMKARIGKSPDIADAALMLIDLCRSKHRFRSVIRSTKAERTGKSWKKFLFRQDVTTKSGRFLAKEPV